MLRGRVSMTWPDFQRHVIVVNGVRHRLQPKLAELAFLLLARRGQFVPMPHVIEFLWPEPDEEPDYSEDVIRTYVSRLRKVLPPESVIARATSCTDRMEAGHYLPGALMLQRECAVVIQPTLFGDLPVHLKPARPSLQPASKELPRRRAAREAISGVHSGIRTVRRRVRLPRLPQRAFAWLEVQL